jgi:hypothetical protein
MSLNKRLANLGPSDGTTRFVDLRRQARLAGNDNGGHAAWVAERMRSHMADPVAWCRTANDQQVPELLHAAFAQLLDHDPAGLPAEALTRHLHDTALRPAIIATVLARTELDPITRQVIADLDTADAAQLQALLGRQAPDEVLHALLLHPVPAIASAAALSFSIGLPLGPTLPESWHDDWEAAIRTLRVDDLDQGTRWRAEYLLNHLATHNPDLFEQWLTRRFDEMNSKGFLRPVEPRGCEQHLHALPQPGRERLTRHYVNIDKPRFGQSLLTYLIGADRELAERLLTQQVIATNHLLDAITGQCNTVLEQLGPLLLEREVNPETIAANAGVPTGFRFGPESTMHAQMFEYFTSFGDRIPALQPIAQAGSAQQAERQQKAEAQERQERIHGL